MLLGGLLCRVSLNLLARSDVAALMKCFPLMPLQLSSTFVAAFLMLR
jgi:preprotein translocase subunit SecF